MRYAWLVMSIALLTIPGRLSAFDFSRMLVYKLEAICDAARLGQWDAYVAGHAWHMPFGYDKATRARLNDTAWGGGFGRTLRDEDGDRHSVYFMGFSDSHHAPQLNVGYAWQRCWPVTRGLSVGAGYLAFLFSRGDVANHLPMPGVLPCASLQIRGIEIVTLFVPRLSQDIQGNVLFFFLRMPLGRGRGRNFPEANALREDARRWR